MDYVKIRDDIRDTVSNMKCRSDHVIVFDIDDTLVYSRSNIPIKPMIQIYNYLIKRFKVFLITARDPAYREFTVEQLESLGVTGYEALLMVGNKDKGEKKRRMRKHIEKRGHIILFNIGDKKSDFYGGYYDVGYKLPTL